MEADRLLDVVESLCELELYILSNMYIKNCANCHNYIFQPVNAQYSHQCLLRVQGCLKSTIGWVFLLLFDLYKLPDAVSRIHQKASHFWVYGIMTLNARQMLIWGISVLLGVNTHLENVIMPVSCNHQISYFAACWQYHTTPVRRWS